MLAPPNSQKTWSPFEALSRWWRDWTERGAASELRCCAEDEIARMAQDAGVSVTEFRKLSRLGPEAADLLLRRMEALNLDPKEVSQTERRTLQDLQRVCAMCESHRRCARDLAHDSENPVWEDYCPNAETLKSLNAMPWSSRREW
jgi:hypothetical protein